MFYDCVYGCEVKWLALTLKTFVFPGVHFATGELVTSQFKKREREEKDTCLEILLEIPLHAAELEFWFLP